jgi:hypothetical protein
MNKIAKCSIVIYDDYGNVLITQRGKIKRGETEIWSLFEKELKGKETEEKCITKAIDKDLKCTVFDLKQFKEYSLNESDDKLLVYTGTIKEWMQVHRDINKTYWLSQKQLDEYKFSSLEKQILMDFFNSTKKAVN